MKLSVPPCLFGLIFFIFCFTNSFGQQEKIFTPLNIQKSIDKGIRTVDGRPGKNYWQNTAEYNLKIKFTPKTRLVEGSEDVVYFNRSPDTLRKIIVRLYPDYYKKGAVRNYEIDAQDESEGVKITSLKINEQFFDTNEKGLSEGITRGVQKEGTNLVIHPKYIMPASKINLHITWNYILNKGSHVRMGQVDEGSYFIAYSFPRIAVYDDIDGWDTSSYLGVQEPYFDFGNFNAEITVPKNFMVWATGTLTNGKDVLSNKVYYMLERAKLSDDMVNIIDSNDVEQNNITAKNKWNTFKFTAKNVPDFAFALSNHYLWQASSIDVHHTGDMKSLVGAAFNKNHKDYFDVPRVARRCLEIMSGDFPGDPYPYEHMTVFDGLDQMEYPMMVNDNPTKSWEDMVELTDHEIMHSYFPFFMGINQTKYAWMDEGWATIGEWIISPKIDSTLVDLYGIDDVNNMSGKESDVPMIVNSTQLTGRTYFINSYPKPAFAYLYLKDMLGDFDFKKCLILYMNSWHDKHPTPWDFFNMFNTISGKNLNWYWQRWFYDWGYPNLAIKHVEKKDDGYEISIQSKGTKPVPINIVAEYEDGTKEKLHRSCEVWKDTSETTLKTSSAKAIKKITLGDTYDVDIDKSDNIYLPAK